MENKARKEVCRRHSIKIYGYQVQFPGVEVKESNYVHFNEFELGFKSEFKADQDYFLFQ